MTLSHSFCLIGVFLLSAHGATAAALKCRVLYRITCAPDLCSPLDKVVDEVPQIPKISIIISANRKSLTYIEGKKVRRAAISVSRLGHGFRLVSGKIRWPSYESGMRSKSRPLGRVRMIFDGTIYYWRVGYLGTSEAQEYEDVLIGDCVGSHW